MLNSRSNKNKKNLQAKYEAAKSSAFGFCPTIHIIQRYNKENVKKKQIFFRFFFLKCPFLFSEEPKIKNDRKKFLFLILRHFYSSIYKLSNSKQQPLKMLPFFFFYPYGLQKFLINKTLFLQVHKL